MGDKKSLYHNLLLALIALLSLYLIIRAQSNHSDGAAIPEILLGGALLFTVWRLFTTARQTLHSRAQTDEPRNEAGSASREFLLYRALINNYPGGVLLLYDREFRSQIMSGKLLGSKGFPAQPVEDKMIWELLPPPLWQG